METYERKVDKLINRLTELIEKMEAEWEADFTVQQSIDKFYFIQKSVELKLLCEAIQMNRLDQSRIEKHYQQVYFRWRKDIRWLHARRLRPNG